MFYIYVFVCAIGTIILTHYFVSLFCKEKNRKVDGLIMKANTIDENFPVYLFNNFFVIGKDLYFITGDVNINDKSVSICGKHSDMTPCYHFEKDLELQYIDSLKRFNVIEM